jgi:hypothetical protein
MARPLKETRACQAFTPQVDSTRMHPTAARITNVEDVPAKEVSLLGRARYWGSVPNVRRGILTE